MVNLGDLYMEGSGVDKSVEQAIKCYTAAAEKGHVEAKKRLATAVRLRRKETTR